MVTGWGKKEPDQGEVEGQGEGQDFVGVEFPVAVAFVGPFDGGDAGLGKPLAEEPFEGAGGLFRVQPRSSRAAEVVGDDLIEVGLAGPAGGGLGVGVRWCPSASDHARSLALHPIVDAFPMDTPS